MTARGKSLVQIKDDFMSGFEHIVAIHLKDAKIGEIRRVPFGEGIVDFDALFSLLQDNKYTGLFVTEMWSDDKPGALDDIKKAHKYLKDKMTKVVNNISKC